ncbi:MAG: Ig-like domain-containing protein [Opitutaceae bacterium]
MRGTPMKGIHCLSAACLSALCTASQADILVGYDFDNGTGTATQAANITAPNLTATDYDTGSGLISSVYTTFAPTDGLDAEGNTFGTTNAFSFGGPQSIFGFVDMNNSDNLASALSANDYMTFAVTPDSLHRLNLASLTFRTYAKELNNAPERWALFSSVNGFTVGNEIATGQTTDILTWDSATNNIVVDLSDSKFQNLEDSIEFRLYVYGGNSSSNSAVAFDKVVLNGTAENSILVGYDFDAAAADPSEATVLASNVSASPLSSPMDISFVDTASDTTGLDAYGLELGSASSVGAVGIQVIDATRQTFELAVDGDDYLSFTVIPDSGSALHLTGISYKATKKTEPSVDEYALTDAAGNMIGSPTVITNVVGLTGAYDGIVIDLSGTEFEYVTEPTEFRIYAWGRGSNKTANTLAAIDKLTVHGSSFVMGADYYVATNGSDSNAGSLSQPLATVQKAVDLAGPGSTIYIRGGSYHEQVDLSGVAGTEEMPITLTPYNGETVTFDGTTTISSNWTQDSGNVYKTTLSEDITQLFVDDQIMTLARFPNALVWSDEMWDARTKKQNNSGRYVNGADIVGETGVSFEGCVGLFNFGAYATNIALVSSHVAGSNDFDYAPTSGIYRTTDDYFLEGGVDGAERALLDIAQEWAYDESTKTLYLWADDGQNPNGRQIAGKVQSVAIIGDASTQNIVLDGLDFFATTFQFTSSDGITIQNCDSSYYTASNRALGSLGSADTAQVVGSAEDFCEDFVLYNNSFRYSEVIGLLSAYTKDARIENNLFENINYTCAQNASVQTSQAHNLIHRRNTLINSGPYAGFRFGLYDDGNEVRPFILELNYTERCSLHQEDGTSFYSAGGSVVESVWRYNWGHSSKEKDYRFDGANNPLTGVDANFYRNVALSGTYKKVNDSGAAYKLKGDFHEIAHNLSVHPRGDFEISVEKGGNANSQIFNNIADHLAGNDDNLDIPGTASNNFIGQRDPRRTQDILRDPYGLDFRPRADALEIIDQGIPVTMSWIHGDLDVNGDYLGAAPDLGAYEYGDDNYWIPGYKHTHASHPYPADERADALLTSDLMWRGGLNAVSYNVYLGNSANSLSFMGNQQNNIFTPSSLTNDQSYFWRVDCVLADGSTVSGEVWTFTINDHNADPLSTRVEVLEDSPTAFQLQGSDPDGGSLSFAVIQQPAHGDLSGTAPNLVYTPDENFSGVDSIRFTVNDASRRGIVIFNVTEVYDAPSFSSGSLNVAGGYAGSVYSGSIAGTVSNPEGSSLTFSLMSGPSWLSLDSAGNLSGAPGTGDLGLHLVDVMVSDGLGNNDTASIEIRILSEILAGYDFAANASNPSLATQVVAGLSASAITSPMNIDYVTGFGDDSGTDAHGVPFGDASTLGAIGLQVIDATTGSFANAVAGDDYLAFTLTPDVGTGFQLDTIAFKSLSDLVFDSNLDGVKLD